MDVDSIPFGVDFRSHIGDAVEQCDYLLALIGDSWINVKDDSGQRRIDSPNDFVRLELESALDRGIPVVPVLLGNAQMPKECELPESLRRLKYRNAAEIRPGRDLNHHIDTLISDITGSTDAATSQPNSDGGHKTAKEAYFSWKGLGLIDLIPGIRDLPYPVRLVIALIVIAMLVIAFL